MGERNKGDGIIGERVNKGAKGRGVRRYREGQAGPSPWLIEPDWFTFSHAGKAQAVSDGPSLSVHFLTYFYLCIFWPQWVFIAALELSLLATSWGYSSLQCRASHYGGLSCRARALEAHGLP